MFFESKMGQTKHKPLRTRDFLRFFTRNRGLHFEHIFFENKDKDRILLCRLNNQIIKSISNNKEHQEQVVKNMMKNVMISDTLVYY